MFDFFKKKRDAKPKLKYATKEEELLARYKQELEELENSPHLETMYNITRNKKTGNISEAEEVPFKDTFRFLFEVDKRKMDTKSFLALDTEYITTNYENGYTRKSFYSMGKGYNGMYESYYSPVLHILYDDNEKKYYFEMTEYMNYNYQHEYAYEYKSKPYDDVISLQREVMILHDIIKIEREVKQLEKVVAKQQLEAKAWSNVKTLG